MSITERPPSRWRGFWEWARRPLAIAALSRLALFFVGYINMVRQPHRPFPDLPSRPYLDGWFHWDGGWYINIIRNGYSLTELAPGQRNTVFFPLYPLLSRAVAWLTGDVMWACVIVSNVCFIAAAVVLYRFVREKWDSRVAENTVLLLCTAPHSFYFSACYTESLFLLLWVCAFYAGHRQVWWAAGLFVALAGATRLIGLSALGGLALVALEQANWRIKHVSPRVLWLALGFTGALAYIAFLGFVLHDPWAFGGHGDVAGWGKGHTFQEFVTTYGRMFNLTAIAKGTVPIADHTHLVLLTAATVFTLTCWRRLGPALVLFCLVTLGVYWKVWYSSSRYVLTLFPLYIGVALALRGRRLAFTGLVAFDAVLLGHFTWLYNHREWVS